MFTTWCEKMMIFHFEKKREKSSLIKNVNGPVWRGVWLSVLWFKRFNASYHCTRYGTVHVPPCVEVAELPVWIQTVYIHRCFFFGFFLNKCRDLWRTSVCFMKETDVRNLRWGERWIQKALEHHQTGKVSHPQMSRGERKKSSQIFPSLPKWQLVCKLLPPPPALPSPSSISPPKST